MLRLWSSVVYQAIYDIFEGGVDDKEDAIVWYLSPDFEICCDYAGIDPAKMRDTMGKLITLSKQDRINALHSMRRYLETA